MNKKRTYSRYSTTAMALLGKSIRLRRMERKFTAQDLADRAGISRGTLNKIENGDMRCEIGVVFELAALLGIKLFDSDENTLAMTVDRFDDKIALLPKSVRTGKKIVKDDF